MLTHGDLVSLLVHASYVAWSTRAVAEANEAWRRTPHGDSLGIMDVGGLHHWLYRWGVDSGRLKAGKRKQSYSWHVAKMFDDDRRAVIEEARKYWYLKVEERMAS